MSASVDLYRHRNPTDGREVLFEVSLATGGEVARAAERVSRRQREWQTAPDRILRLAEWRRLLQARRADWIGRLVRDVGKPLVDAEGEVAYGLALVEETLTQLQVSERSRHATHRPHGVVALITPFNNPFAIPVGKIAPALGYGNTVLWKPALPAWELSKLVFESLDEAGLSGFVSLIAGGAEAGRLLPQMEAVRAVSFTGSVAAGREIIRAGGERMIPVQAELGGNNAAIVLADSDLTAAASDLAPAIFSFACQRCTAIRRVIVEQAVFDRFSDLLRQSVEALEVGPPASRATQMGPVISHERQTLLLEMVATACRSGAWALIGGRSPPHLDPNGFWLEPTVMTGLSPDSPIVTQELFGPVVALLPAEDLDHALRLHNGVEHGLLGAVFSSSPESQGRFLEEAQAGILSINRARPAFARGGPFVGWKASGFGPPEHGRWNLEFYTRAQAAYVQ